jgi:nitric oxide reductase NorQ protein
MNASVSNIKQIIKSGVPLLIEGPTGTGKTYTVMQVAKDNNKTLHIINVSGELTVDSILGQQTLIDGNVVWRDGVLTAAMRKGDWVLFDELNTALPEVLTIINGVLDDSHSVTLPNADNERVTAHDGFRFIGTQNPAGGSYAGTAKLNEALVNRMVKLTMDYMDFDNEVEALKRHTKMADSSVVQLVKIAHFTRREMDDHLSTRDLVKIIRLREQGGMALRDAIMTVVLPRLGNDGYRKVYEYHSSVMRELRDMDAEDKDPFEVIKQKMADLRTREDEIREEKSNIREAVRKEILRDLLGGAVKQES